MGFFGLGRGLSLLFKIGDEVASVLSELLEDIEGVVQVLEPDRIYDVAAGGGGAEEVQDRPDIT